MYTLSKIGSVPPVGCSDTAAVPVLSLALFHYRLHMEAISSSRRQYIAVFCILSMVQTLRSVQIMAQPLEHYLKSQDSELARVHVELRLR